MKLYCELYVDKELQKKKEKILKKLKKDKPLLEGYAILLADRKDENLEILSSAFLYERRPKNEQRLLVGIAASLENAFAYVTELTDRIYQETKKADIREYILRKQQQFEKEGSL